MLSKLLLTEDQEEQSSTHGGGSQRTVYSKPRIKARTKQNLWNVKQERPELFASAGASGAGAAAGGNAGAETSRPSADAPPGFGPCGREGWLHHSGKGLFLEVETGRRFWFDAVANEYRDLNEGALLDLVCTGGAATGLGGGAASRGTGAAASSAAGSGAAGAKQPAPRNIIVPDLHRTAQALKAELDHLDRPAALAVVFSAATGDAAAATEAAALGLHEKLIRRLAAFRGKWLAESLCEALSGALGDVAAAHGGQRPQAAVALAVGDRVVVSAAPSASSCVVLRAGAGGSAEAAVVAEACAGVAAGAEAQEGPTAQCFKLAEASSEALCVALAAGDARLEEVDVAVAALPQLGLGRPRAASVGLLRAARQRGATGQLVAACVRLGPPLQPAATSGRPPAKRQRTEEASSKIRVRQILLRHWRGAGAAPTDPVRRKSVSRTPEEAEARMLQVLEGLTKDSCAGFSNACKAISECQSALKGGELAGDMGWLDRGKGVDAQQANGRTVRPVTPAPVLKAAFELEIGQLGDLVSSDIGVHLLLRTA